MSDQVLLEVKNLVKRFPIKGGFGEKKLVLLMRLTMFLSQLKKVKL